MSLTRAGRNGWWHFQLKQFPSRSATVAYATWKNTPEIYFVGKRCSFSTCEKHARPGFTADCPAGSGALGMGGLEHSARAGGGGSALTSRCLFPQELHSHKTKDHFQLTGIVKLFSPLRLKCVPRGPRGPLWEGRLAGSGAPWELNGEPYVSKNTRLHPSGSEPVYFSSTFCSICLQEMVAALNSSLGKRE